MAEIIVVDSGIILASVLGESQSQNAQLLLKRWRGSKIDLAAPSLFRYELVAVLRKWVYQRRLSAEESQSILDSLLNYPMQLYFDEMLLKRAYELATRFDRPTAYDSQYLAVAERLKCDFWTADERLYNAIAHRLTWVKWIGNPD
ncbi:MAG: type II toxin-antitoxin system VapC family toxin [Anaerolineae bacterium]|nr:type II toxin-antitoxin system VapC family toxin [Anaerolineae bacterium]